MSTPLLELCSVTKNYGHVVALSEASIAVPPSAVVALVGDNGAGKSTMVKLMSGLVQPDTGQVRLSGHDVSLTSPSHARRLGVATVFQDLALVEVLDVATNMFLGEFPTKYGFVNHRAMEVEARKFLDRLGVTVADVRVPVGMLSGGQRQIVAIARALRLGSRVLLLDEPTAALGVRETQQTGELIRSYRTGENSVVIVSHDLDFVFGVADYIQVLRLGRPVAMLSADQTSREEVVGLITGGRQPLEDQGRA